jgi:hypothetical protein
MLKLIRETPWIKEWQTPWGSYIDSKLRWLGIEPSASAFLAAWNAAADPEKFDLEAAFEFYPYELEEDIEQILAAIAGEDEPRAQRMAQKLFRADSELSPDQQRFLAALGQHLEAASAPMRLIGENKWFAAYANDAGFHLDTRITSPFDMPTDDELQQHIDTSLSLAYKRILEVVKEHPYLIEPRPGEQAFPSL